jgi:hypothetical protein
VKGTTVTRAVETPAIERDIVAREVLTSWAQQRRRERDERWKLAKAKLKLAALVDDLLRRRAGE